MTTDEYESPSSLLAELNGHNAPRFGRNPRRTVVVLGAEPSATARTVWMLAELGLFMGRSFTADGQDWAFCVPTPVSSVGAWTNPGRVWVDHIRETAARRNRDHQLWGLNAQLDLAKLSWMGERLCEPYCVLPSMAVAPLVADDFARATQDDKVIDLARAHLELCRHVRDEGLPAAVFDLSCAVSRAREFIAELVRRLGIEVTEAKIEAAQAAFQRPHHSPWARRLLGYVDSVSEARVSGWAADPEEPSRPLELSLLVDGRCVAQTVADLPRPDVQAVGLHPSGNCGYVLSTPPESIGLGQEVRVVDARGRDLNKSGVLHRPGILRELQFPRQVSTESGFASREARQWMRSIQSLLRCRSSR